MKEVEDVVDRNIATWISTMARRDTPYPPKRIDLAQSISHLSLDISAHMCLGTSFGCLESGRDQHGFLEMIRSNMGVQQFLSLYHEAFRLLQFVANTPLGRLFVPSVDDGSTIGGVLEVSMACPGHVHVSVLTHCRCLIGAHTNVIRRKL